MAHGRRTRMVVAGAVLGLFVVAGVALAVTREMPSVPGLGSNRSVRAPTHSAWELEVRELAPAHWWRLSETKGDAADSIGEADGAYEGTGLTRGADGLAGFEEHAALQINGSSGRVLLPTTAAPTSLPFTIFGAFKIDGEPKGERFLWHQLGPIAFVLVSYDPTTDTIRFKTADAVGKVNIARSAAGVSDGQRHSFAVTQRSTGKMSVYIDGVDQTDQTVGPTPTALPTAAAVALGAMNFDTSSFVWAGTIDDVLLIDGTALSSVQVDALHDAMVAR